MQQTTIIGHIGANATVNNVNGEEVVSFNVAVTERYKTKDGEKKENTTWFSCSYWNRANLVPYLLTGTLVHIAGKVRADVYRNKEGIAKAALRLNVDRLDLLGSKKEASAEGATALANNTAPTPQTEGAAPGSADEVPF